MTGNGPKSTRQEPSVPGMERVQPASHSTFKLRFHNNESGHPVLATSGRLARAGDTALFDFDGNRNRLAWREHSGYVVRTLCRNAVPLYVRHCGGEVWISNDVAELVTGGETISVRGIEFLAAIASPHAIKSIFAHLLEDVSLLLPASLYTIGLSAEGRVQCRWKDVVFEQTAISREDFLDLLIEKYRGAFSQHEDICLALSGGYDSRFELSLLAHLKKRVHCFHYERFQRERRVASGIAAACGASFHAVPMSTAAREGWKLVHDRGYTTRWDGYFSTGTLPSAGIYAEMERQWPAAQKQLLMTGALKGRLYEKGDGIFAHWEATKEGQFARLRRAFPECEPSINLERERRSQIIRDVETKIREKTDKSDVMTDISYHFFYRSQGKVATRLTFLVENGMPTPTTEQTVRDSFAALPIAEKNGEAFLTWAIGKLSPRLLELPWVSSSESILDRQFGFAARLPLAGALLSRYRAPDVGDVADWISEDDQEELLRELPGLRAATTKVQNGEARLHVAMIYKFLQTLRTRKGITYRLAA